MVHKSTMLGTGGGGVSSLNSLTGALSLTSDGGSITITPSGSTINLESVSGGAGTVTSVSVVSANGLNGTVATATSTPAITLSTTVTGILKGDGTAISASNVTDDAQTKAAIVPNTAPSAGQLLVGNAGGTAYAPVSSSGDVTITSAGVTAIGANKVNYAQMQQAAAHVLLGNPTGSTANISAITLGSGLAFSGTTLTASGSGGTVTTTGLPSSGKLTKFSGLSSITTGDLSGDVTTSGTLAATVVKINGAAVPTIPATNKFLTSDGSQWVATYSVNQNLQTVDSPTFGGLTLSGGTTGSGNFALATGPTLSNPVVGTQASSDNSTKAASTAYVTTAVSNALNGLDWKPAVGYATTANVVGTNTAGVFTYTSTGVDTIDGHQLALNDVVLFKNQTTGADNGVWVVTTAGAIGIAGVLTRRSDYNAAADIHQGDTFYVINGTANGNTSWVQTDVVTTINSDPLAFSQVAGPGTYAAGTGLTLTGNSFSVNASQTQVTAVGTLTSGAWNATKVGLAYGGTNADLSATGAAHNYLKQSSSGAAITVGQPAASDLSDGTTGSGAVVLATSATLVTPALGTPTALVATNATGTASGLTAGTVTTNANLTGAVTSSGNATTLVSALTFSAGSANAVGNQTITADAKAAFGYTINSIRGAATVSGSITLAVKINGTNVTGLSAVGITSTPGDTNATAANTVAAGDRVTWVFSSASSDLGAEFTMKITRT